jgi:hypothetical protein
MSSRCQRNSVSGLTGNACHDRRGSTRTQRREYQPIACGQLRPPHLPPQDRHLMQQQDDLEFLRAVTTPE